MINIAWLILGIVIGIASLIAAVNVGIYLRQTVDGLEALTKRVGAIEHDQADTTPDIVVAKSAKQVREHKFDDDNDSAIVDALSPKEIAERKKAQMLKEIEDADV